MRELVIPAGEKISVEKGAVRLDLLDIHRDATLVVRGSTTIFAGRLVTQTGAQIVYESEEVNNDAVVTVNALDASGVTELKFIGNGKTGDGFNAAARARNGGNGRDARDCKPSDLDGRRASGGGTGSAGAAGQDGEDAVDFVLNFPMLAPGASVSVEALSGNGGNGQNGGNGGNGGNRSNCHDGENGGDGGAGGNGGNGGDAARIMIFVIIPDDVYLDRARSNAVIGTIRFSLNTVPGEGGHGGSGGTGGRSGKGALIGPGHSRDGRSGRDGNNGLRGDGPMPGSPNNGNWVTVDVMAANAYQQYIAQQLQNIGH